VTIRGETTIMDKPKTLVVTVPDMIEQRDLEPLNGKSDVTYREMEHVDEDELAKLCEGYEYLMLNYDVIKELSSRFYDHENVRQLKAISVDITGMDWSSPAAAREAGVVLLNIPHYSTESVAESILAEVFLHSRQRHLAYVDEINGREIQGRKGINLLGNIGGVVGLGSIGTRTAELLEAVGMTVVAWNRSPRANRSLVPLEELFDRSKVICICLKTVRVGDETNVGIVSDELLSRCNGAIIVNLANQDLVDHGALIGHIRSRRVVGYSVDRTPALLASPLTDVEEVHMPPTNAWFSDESLNTLREIWVRNVISAIDGSLENVYTD
jgi:glycerate dehydrogenase